MALERIVLSKTTLSTQTPSKLDTEDGSVVVSRVIGAVKSDAHICASLLTAPQYRQLSDQLKATEKRMADLSAMRTQILNYIKTRDTYVAYRKAGYSKKFLAEHEGDLTLHRAAKKFFDDQGLTKLPTIKEIQAEFTALQAEKKAVYPDFHEARTQMRELLTVKANVDRLLHPREQAQKEWVL